MQPAVNSTHRDHGSKLSPSTAWTPSVPSTKRAVRASLSHGGVSY